jgi:D-sedoheptulose 7-phosphate isomerase
MIDVNQYLQTVAQNFESLRGSKANIEAAAEACISALRNGGKVIFCGNGGSAADSQHLAAELMGRFLFDRNPLPALALTVDTSALTAIGNDYGYDNVFARQLKGIGRPGDVLVGLSTSGTSKNVVRAFEVAEEIGITRIALTGAVGSPMSAMAEVAVMVPSTQTNHIQEMHIAVGHIICGLVEETLCSAKL